MVGRRGYAPGLQWEPYFGRASPTLGGRELGGPPLRIGSRRRRGWGRTGGVDRGSLGAEDPSIMEKKGIDQSVGRQDSYWGISLEYF